VQGEIEKAIEKVTRQKVRIVGAGRTDAGVHALGQVIAFNVMWRHSAQDLQRALNAVLPMDIALRDCEIVHFDFHPRYDALWRQYRYTVWNDAVRSPLWQRYAYHVPEPLDMLAMQRATQHLIGCHNFAAFGRAPKGSNTVRRVLQAGWITEGKRLIFEITADAFLRRMVRTIVGTLLQIGRGQRAPEEMALLVQGSAKRLAAPPAPAQGLCLVKIGYAD
jgi:tRNA pseudouridine38-40 synthase